MSGKESDWSEGQLLRNTNHIDRMMALKMARHDCSLMLDVLDRIIRAAFVSIGYESPTDDQRLAITEFNLSKGKTFSSASRLEKARVCGCVYTVTLSAENAQKRKLFFADAPFVYTTTMKTSSVFKRSIIKTKTLLKVETFKNDKTVTTIFIV